MGVPLFFFRQIDPLDNVPVAQISMVEIFEDQCTFKIVDGEGVPSNRVVKKTDFITNQIQQFNIEKFGEL